VNIFGSAEFKLLYVNPLVILKQAEKISADLAVEPTKDKLILKNWDPQKVTRLCGKNCFEGNWNISTFPNFCSLCQSGTMKPYRISDFVRSRGVVYVGHRTSD
jgi:hypothetical protein